MPVAAAHPISLRAAERERLEKRAYGHKTEHRLRIRAPVPPARWSCPGSATEVTTRGITGAISASPVRRRLAEDAFKPWRHRSWIFITDPDFRAKAQRVLDLYEKTSAFGSYPGCVTLAGLPSVAPAHRRIRG
ncbi:hypothetical protein ACWC09_39720 [Streptomyces sp. NPDC001617]